MATLEQVISAFVAGDGNGMRASSLSVRDNTLYSYSYPLAYRGRDVNGNTTVFVNTARTGEIVANKPNPFGGSGMYVHGLSERQHKLRERDTAYSVTTSRQRSKVRNAANDEYLNVIECEFVDGAIPPLHMLSGRYDGYRAPVLNY